MDAAALRPKHTVNNIQKLGNISSIATFVLKEIFPLGSDLQTQTGNGRSHLEQVGRFDERSNLWS